MYSPNCWNFRRGFDSRPPGVIMSPFVLAGPSWRAFQLQWWELLFGSLAQLEILNLRFYTHSCPLQCLDEVNITVETCELNDRGASGSSASGPPPGIAAPQGKYSFIHKVIDGITIIVNTVNVKFKSPAFTASVQVRTYFNRRTFRYLICLLFCSDVPNSCRIKNSKMVAWWFACHASKRSSQRNTTNLQRVIMANSSHWG